MKWRKWKDDKESVGIADVVGVVKKGLGEYHDYLLGAAKERLRESVNKGKSYKEMKKALVIDEAGKYPGAGLFLVPWKCDAANEEKIKEECKATIRCYPLDVNEAGAWEGKKCFYSGEDATHMALFGRAF